MNKILNGCCKNTGELLQEAGTKTTQTVLAHTEKYHDAYTTIDKIVDSFGNVYLISALRLLFSYFLATNQII